MRTKPVEALLYRALGSIQTAEASAMTGCERTDRSL